MTRSNQHPAPVNLMVWNAARGGMRSVVEAYRRDGFLERENVRLFASYVDGGFLRRQLALLSAYARFLFCLMTVRRVGVVHCHAAMRGSFWRKSLFATTARAFGKPVILHLHGSEMQGFYRSQGMRVQALIRRQLEKATRVVVLSQSWRDFVQGIAPGARVEVVPNYVTLPQLPDADTRRDDAMLFLGLVGERKGVWDLIPAMGEVRRTHPAARITIAGNGENERAGAAVRDAGLTEVVALPGWTDGDAKTALLASAGIYVLPSHNEGLPMSVLEAMSWRMAVVTTRVGGIPELITDGVDGLLVEAGDREALAGALVRLLDDAPLRDRLATAARARIEAHYSERAVLPMLQKLYRACLDRDAARRSEPPTDPMTSLD